MEKMLRITTGEFKGRKIRTPGGQTHPMSERARIAVFNMLGDRVEGAWVMDLFAGSGALGIEALSRGARFALFIDNSPAAIRTINENLMDLGLYGIRGGALESNINRTARTATDRYHIVIADPPYDEYNEKYVKYYARLVADRGTLVLSHPGEAPEVKGMLLETSHKYSECRISIYRKI